MHFPYYTHFPSVLWCCWLGLLICKTHYRVGEPTAAWQFVDIHPHRSFDNGRQYVSCGQRQSPLSGAPVNKMAVDYHEGETDPYGLRVWWNSSSLRDIFVPPLGSARRARHDNNNNDNNNLCSRTIRTCETISPRLNIMKQYRGLGVGNLALQAVDNVLAFKFWDQPMLCRRVACQKYPQYYCYCWRYP